MKDDELEKEINKLVETVCDWWVEALHNNAEEIEQENIGRFREIMFLRLKAELAINEYASLETNYYPERLLAKIALESKIDLALFPKHVFMDLTVNEVGIRKNCQPRRILYSTQNSYTL